MVLCPFSTGKSFIAVGSIAMYTGGFRYRVVEAGRHIWR